MAGFRKETLFARELPGHLAPTLAAACSFMKAVQDARDGDASATQTLLTLHAQLMDEGRSLWPSPDAVDQSAAEAAFVSGVLRAVHYTETIAKEELPVVDTAGSQTLSAFSSDLAPYSQSQVRRAIAQAFDPSETLLADIEQRMEEELGQLSLRHRIMAGLQELFPLVPDGDNRASVDALFSALHPDHPLQSGEVELIRTATGLFFCVPFDGDVLSTRAHTPPDVRAFLAHLTHSDPSYSAHFPSFGSLRAQDVPRDLHERLVQCTGIDPSTVKQVLPTMVVVLPTAKVDQYIVHDAWGHGWQALLFRFEETYQRTVRCNRLPTLDESFVCVDGTTEITMREAFAALGAGDEGLEVWRRFLEAATAHRLLDSLGGLNAEVLADVVEYKFLAQHPEHLHLMPSSSFVKTFPTKLDLTLLDMPMYFARALEGFERLANSGGNIPGLLKALGGGDDMAQALRRAAAFTGPWLQKVHGSWPEMDDRDGFASNTMGRVALSYVELHALFNALYAELREQDPQVRFADAMVFSAAAFLEADWAGRFWFLDEYLVWFPTLYARLKSFLPEADNG